MKSIDQRDNSSEQLFLYHNTMTSLIIKIQNLAGETIETIKECLTPDEQSEAVEIYMVENWDRPAKTEDAIDFILNVL